MEQYYECMHNETCAEIVKTRYPTIVLVHANNAYGFANNRRFTEENVDLNRNFLTSAEFDEVISRDHNFAGIDMTNCIFNCFCFQFHSINYIGYVNLDPVINPTTAAYFKIPADARPPIPYGEPNAPVFLTQEWIDEHKIRAMLLANDAVTLFNTFIAGMFFN